ncbi:TIM barrel protein [Candidatus Peregrinibacteria bacterium]|nr:TIM barrel protein [Candidatus Peregrinibacteria bacterium]
MPLQFAVAGAPHGTPGSGGTVRGLQYAHSLGISAMELEWVQSVPKNPERMSEVRSTAESLGMTLTVHAPYFVNLNADDPGKLSASVRRILDALSMAQLCGAVSVCVHPAFYLEKDPAIALENVRKATDEIMEHKSRLFPDVNLGYETMGKPTQFGTLEEVLIISREFGIYPTVDPAHMHARSNGAWNTTEEWHAMFDLYAEYLGTSSLRKMHIHYSGIAYSMKGEKHHVPLEESDARWRDFLSVLKDRRIGGVVVCESPLLESDTLLLQEAFTAL